MTCVAYNYIKLFKICVCGKIMNVINLVIIVHCKKKNIFKYKIYNTANLHRHGIMCILPNFIVL